MVAVNWRGVKGLGRTAAAPTFSAMLRKSRPGSIELRNLKPDIARIETFGASSRSFPMISRPFFSGMKRSTITRSKLDDLNACKPLCAVSVCSAWAPWRVNVSLIAAPTEGSSSMISTRAITRAAKVHVNVVPFEFDDRQRRLARDNSSKVAQLITLHHSNHLFNKALLSKIKILT
jgi:hypothetical protein